MQIRVSSRTSLFFVKMSGFMVHRVASFYSVPKDFLDLMIDLEGGEDDNTGPHRGLAQFNRSTWNSVTDLDFDLYVMDPAASLIASSLLYLSNKQDFERSYPNATFTPPIAYLFHNQGTPNALRFLRTGRLTGSQSTKAIQIFEDISL